MNPEIELSRLISYTPMGFSFRLTELGYEELITLCPPEATSSDLIGLITDFLHPNGERASYDLLDQFLPYYQEDQQ